MIKWSFDNLAQIAAEHSCSEQNFGDYSGKISEFLQAIERRDQDFYKIIDDQEVLKNIQNYARSVEGKYDFIVILGIGGSALGALCLEQFLRPLSGEKKPVLVVLDNIDPVFLAETEATLKLEKTLFVVITKSGGTPETLAQFLYFKGKVEAAGLAIAEHFAVVTDPLKGLLREFVNQHQDIPVFDVPEKVGGRFSVLTVAGLLPAALLGFNLENLLAGAQAGRKTFMNSEWSANIAFRLALIQYLLYQKGKHLTVMFPYAQKLIKLADWYRQLLAESIGKAVNDEGKTINVGITPVLALGVTDQHSQNQLYNEGPNDKLFVFLQVNQPEKDLSIPVDIHFEKELGYLRGVTFDQLLKTEMEGTLQALTVNNRPCLTLEIEQLNEFNLGEIILILEGSIAFLGELFAINAYDQPGVELSKNLTKKLLAK